MAVAVALLLLLLQLQLLLLPIQVAQHTRYSVIDQPTCLLDGSFKSFSLM